MTHKKGTNRHVHATTDHGFTIEELEFFAQGNLLVEEAPRRERVGNLSFWICVSIATALALISPYMLS